MKLLRVLMMAVLASLFAGPVIAQSEAVGNVIAGKGGHADRLESKESTKRISVPLQRKSDIEREDIVKAGDIDMQLLLGVDEISLSPNSEISVATYKKTNVPPGEDDQKKVVKLLAGAMRMTTSTISDVKKDISIQAMSGNNLVAQLAIRGTQLGVAVVQSSQGQPMVVGDVVTHSDKDSVIDITTPGGSEQRVSSDKGTMYFKVEGETITESRTPYLKQSAIESEIRQLALERASHPTYTNDFNTIMQNYALHNQIGGTDADIVVKYEGIADFIKAPENNAKQTFVAGSGEFRIEHLYSDFQALYNSFATGDNARERGTPPRPFLDYAPGDPLSLTPTGDQYQNSIGNFATRGFATDALMASTPSELLPFLGSNVFVHSDTSSGNDTLFLNTFNANSTSNTVTKGGVAIQYGEWSVPLSDFSKKVILMPVLAGDKGISESYLTESPSFFWVSTPGLASGVFSSLPTSVTYTFNGASSVFNAKDSFYTGATNPTVSGYLTFDFLHTFPTLSGLMNVVVPADNFLTTPLATSINRLWNVNDFSGAILSFVPDGSGKFVITLPSAASPNGTTHFDVARSNVQNQNVAVFSPFSGTIMGTLTGNNAEAVAGSFNFVAPQQFDSDNSVLTVQHGVSGVFIADRFNFQTPYSLLTASPEEGILASSDSQIGVLDNLKSIDSSAAGVAQTDKMFLDPVNQDIYLNFSSGNNIDKQVMAVDNSLVSFGMWNTRGFSPAVIQEIQVARVNNVGALQGMESRGSEVAWISAVPTTATLPTSGTLAFNMANAQVLGVDSFGTTNASMSGDLTIDFLTYNVAINNLKVLSNFGFGVDEWRVDNVTGTLSSTSHLVLPSLTGTYQAPDVAPLGLTGSMKGFLVGDHAQGVAGGFQFNSNTASSGFDPGVHATSIQGVFSNTGTYAP